MLGEPERGPGCSALHRLLGFLPPPPCLLQALTTWSPFTGSLSAHQSSNNLVSSVGHLQWVSSPSATSIPHDSQNAMSNTLTQLSCNWGAFLKTLLSFYLVLLAPTSSCLLATHSSLNNLWCCFSASCTGSTESVSSSSQCFMLIPTVISLLHLCQD